MTLTRDHVQKVVDVYLAAWRTQDPDLIVTIFTEGAVYHERVLREPIPDRAAIREYWRTKVAESQGNIDCRMLALYVDGETGIVEWEAEFDDLRQRVRKRMKEVAILEFDGKLISSLREYWASDVVG